MKPSSRNVTMYFLAVFGLATLATACAGGGGERGPRRDPSLLTAEELANHPSLNCLEAVRRLRPRWLRGRAGDPVAVRDGTMLGRAEDYLPEIRVGDVESMRYLNATDATMRYGTGVTGGAIVVTSKRK